MKSGPKTAAGFTLVEMLAVIAVIAVLAALLLPVISAGNRKAQRIACTNNLRQIALAVRAYSDDSQDASPSPGWKGLAATNVPSLYSGYKALMKNYVGLNGASSSQNKLFECPADAFYPNWIIAPVAPPLYFVHKSLHDGHSTFGFNTPV